MNYCARKHAETFHHIIKWSLTSVASHNMIISSTGILKMRYIYFSGNKICRLIQNNVAKMKEQKRYTKGIKNPIGSVTKAIRGRLRTFP